MEWITEIAGLLGIIGGLGGGISIWHAYKFRKQDGIKADSEAQQSKAQAYQQDISVSDSAMNTIRELNKMVEGLMDDKIERNKEISSLRDDVQRNQRQMKVVIHKFNLVTEILGEQIELKQHAESHYCSVIECQLREPPFSSYKTSNATNRMKELYEDLRTEKINIKEE